MINADIATVSRFPLIRIFYHEQMSLFFDFIFCGPGRSRENRIKDSILSELYMKLFRFQGISDNNTDNKSCRKIRGYGDSNDKKRYEQLFACIHIQKSEA